MIGTDRSRIWPALVLAAGAMALTAIVILAAGAGIRPAVAGSNPTPAKIVGDVNDDGDVNSVDAALILQVVAGIITEDFLANASSGDVNGDGDLNAIDALIIYQYEAGLLCCLPYPPPPMSTPTALPPGTATVVLLATSTPVSTPSGGGSLDLGDVLENVGEQTDLDLIGLAFPFPGLGGWTIDMTYDPQLVSVEFCSAGAGLSQCNPAFAPGVVRVAGVSVAGLVGNSVLASVTFQCEVAGTSPLTIEPQLLVDGAVGVPQNILALTETSGGSITCLAAPNALGGVAEYPEVAPPSAVEVASRGGKSLSAFEIALIVASVPVTALGWYVRRRLVRR